MVKIPSNSTFKVGSTKMNGENKSSMLDMGKPYTTCIVFIDIGNITTI